MTSRNSLRDLVLGMIARHLEDELKDKVVFLDAIDALALATLMPVSMESLRSKIADQIAEAGPKSAEAMQGFREASVLMATAQRRAE